MTLNITSLCSFSFVWLFVTPWTLACQALLSLEFSRQEYWSGLPFLSPDGAWFSLIAGRFFFLFFLLYNIVLILLYIYMHPPWVYMCSPSWTPLPPPSPYHPSGSSQCTSPKLPVSCIEPGLVICLLYDIKHVLMAFSQIIPHLPLPQSPKDCSIHLCLFCCLIHRVIITIFLNSIYMN